MVGYLDGLLYFRQFRMVGRLYGKYLRSDVIALVSSLDPRKPESPVLSIQNLQVSKKMRYGIDFFMGVKNLLNFTPTRDNVFIIARSHDPFNKNVQRDADGQVMAKAGNSYALTFGPNYVYVPNHGRKLFAGIHYAIPKTGK